MRTPWGRLEVGSGPACEQALTPGVNLVWISKRRKCWTNDDDDSDDDDGRESLPLNKLWSLEPSVSQFPLSPVMATVLSATPTSLFAGRSRVFRPALPSSPLSHSALHLIRIQRITCGVHWRIGKRDWATAAHAASGDYTSDGSSHIRHDQENATKSTAPVWKFWQMNPGELKEKVAKLGRAGLLAYGLFNAVTYTTMFYVAFLAFEKSTGQNPANNLKACLGGMVTMWTGNNFTRPLRVAGAAALAPFMDKVLKKTQKTFQLKDEATTLLFLVMTLIVLCILAVGLLILSRMGR